MSLELRINAFKQEIGITNEELSDKSGIPKSTIDKITSGQTLNPNLETIRAIVYALGKTLDDLNGSLDKSIKKDAHGDIALSVFEIGFINSFRNLNDKGQRIIAEHVDDLVASGKYKKGDTNSGVSSIA